MKWKRRQVQCRVSEALAHLPGSSGASVAPHGLRLGWSEEELGAVSHPLTSLRPWEGQDLAGQLSAAEADHKAVRAAGPLKRDLVVIQLLSHVRLLWPHGLQHARPLCPLLSSLSFLKLMSIESVMLSNRLILCCPLLLLPSVFPSIMVFSSELTLHIRWPKYWSFSISLSSEYSGLVSFRIDWFDFAVQRTLKSLLPTPQFKSINSLVLNFLYGPTLTFLYDYLRNYSFDQRDLCRQRGI